MALTKLQEKWIADVLGVDLRKVPGAPGAPQKLAARAPRLVPNPAPMSTPIAGSPRPGQEARVRRQPERPQAAIHQGRERRRAVRSAAAGTGDCAKKKLPAAALDTGAKGNADLSARGEGGRRPKSPTSCRGWTMNWKPTPGGRPPQPD